MADGILRAGLALITFDCVQLAELRQESPVWRHPGEMPTTPLLWNITDIHIIDPACLRESAGSILA